MNQHIKKIIILVLGVVCVQPFLTGCSTVNADKAEGNGEPNSTEMLLKSAGLSVDSVDEALSKAAKATQEGQMDLAQLFYVKAYELEPKNMLVLQKMTDLYVQLGKNELAEVSLKIIVDQQPKNLKVLEQYGLLLLKNRKYALAKATLEQVVARQKSWSAYNGLGIIANVQGEYPKAEALFRKADAILPNSPELLNNIGFSLYSAYRFPEALAYYNKALQINPNFKKAIYNYALLQARLGKYDIAYDAFVKVASEEEANNNVGYIAMERGDYKKANNYFQEAIRLSPEYYKKANDNLKRLAILEKRGHESAPSN